MKALYKIAIVFFLAATVLQGCIEDFGDLEAPVDRKEQVTGTWKVSKVVQQDLVTTNPEFMNSDITDRFAFTQVTLTLGADGNFSFANPGNAPSFVITSGTWAFDNADFPAALQLEGAGGASSELALSGLNSLTEDNELNLKFVRKVLIPNQANPAINDTVAAVSYNYTFTKQ